MPQIRNIIFFKPFATFRKTDFFFFLLNSKRKQAGLVFFTIIFRAFHSKSRPTVTDFHDDLWKMSGKESLIK